MGLKMGPIKKISKFLQDCSSQVTSILFL